MKTLGLVQIAREAAAAAGNVGRERGPSQTPSAFAKVHDGRDVSAVFQAAGGWPQGSNGCLPVGLDSRAERDRMIVRRLPTGEPWFMATASSRNLPRSLTHPPACPGLDGEWLSESESSGGRWTGTLTLQSTTLCNQPTTNHRRSIRTGMSLCSRFSESTKAPSRLAPSTARSVPPRQISSQAIRFTPTTRSARSCNGWGVWAWLTMSEGGYGRPRGNRPRLVSAVNGQGGRNRMGSETGRRWRVGWSSAARDCFARPGAMGIGALSVGDVSRPRCSNRTLLRLAGFIFSTRRFLRRSPPASGGPVNMTLSDRAGRKTGACRQGIAGKRPNNCSCGMWTGLRWHFVPARSSDSRTRPKPAFPIGALPLRATAGAKGIKGASAHLRYGSKVSHCGVAVSKIPFGKTDHGRSHRQDGVLAHLGDGLRLRWPSADSENPAPFRLCDANTADFQLPTRSSAAFSENFVTTGRTPRTRPSHPTSTSMTLSTSPPIKPMPTSERARRSRRYAGPAGAGSASVLSDAFGDERRVRSSIAQESTLAPRPRSRSVMVWSCT